MLVCISRISDRCLTSVRLVALPMPHIFLLLIRLLSFSLVLPIFLSLHPLLIPLLLLLVYQILLFLLHCDSVRLC